jgi:hypothetical protein
MNLQQHPLSAAFPAMCADDFDSLTDSIQNIGVQNPITLYEGMVIDGWHRYRAASDLGMDCPTVELGDVDPRDFVMAQNKARRHITQAQLAMATTAVYAWRSVGQNQHTEKRVATECPPSKTNAELAAIAGVGVATIKQSKAVQATASPEVVEAVKSGEIGLPKASAIAKLPMAEQAAAIAKPAPKAKPEPVDAPEDDGPSAEEMAAHAASEAADRELVAKLLESDEPLKALAEENKQLKAEIAQLKQARDGYMNRCNEAIALVKSRDRQIAKLEKMLKAEA